MSKRTATVDLNQDNWTEEEAPEDSGIFKKASPNELKMRIIRRGKRRGLMNEGEGTGSSIFKSFKGFGSPTTETNTPTFSFLSDSSNKPKLTSNNPFPPFSFGKKTDNKSSDTAVTDKGDSNNSENKSQGESASSNIPKFNFSASSDKFSDKGKPPVSLLPSFNSTKTSDFPKLNSSEPAAKFGTDSISSESSKTSVASTFKFGLNSKESDVTPSKGDMTFKFGTDTKESEVNKTPVTSAFKFGLNSKENEPSKTVETPGFKFGVNSKEKEVEKTASKSAFKFGVNSEKTEANKPTFQFGIQSSANLSNSNSSSKLDISKQSDSDNSNSSNLNGIECNTNSPTNKGNNSKFLAKLKTLNFGVFKWVNQHLDKNPYINLKPIFDDYERHFQEIKRKYGSCSNDEGTAEVITSSDKQSGSSPTSLTGKPASTLSASSIPLFTFTPATTKSGKTEPFIFGGQSSSTTSAKTAKDVNTTEVKPFTLGVKNSTQTTTTSSVLQTTNTDESPKSSTPLFSFGARDKPVSNSSFTFGSSENKSTFSFGSSNNNCNKSSGFSFDAPKDSKPLGFSFQSSNSSSSIFSFKQSSDSSSSTNEEKTGANEEETDASDEVPKVEVTEVKEEDAIYEKKVKLFYKKDGEYVDKGVGTLFLKPAAEKTQLVIRALTNLGIILLNIILNDSIPTQRVGKNNVLIVCVPNPPLEPKAPEATPVSMLIRVKTESDADELLQKIEEHKK